MSTPQAPRDEDTRIGFSTAKGLGGLLSRLIMLFTGDRYSHVWLLYYDHAFGEDMVMEAHTTWRLIPLRDFERKNNVIAVYRPRTSVDDGLRYGGRLLGTRYDTEGLIGNVVVVVGGWLKRRWRNPFRSSRQVFCSEGVLRVLQAARFPGAAALDPHQVQPGEVERLLREASATRLR